MIDVTKKELPEGWQWTTMDDIAEIVGGGTPKSKEKRYFEGGDIPWLTPADLSGYTAKHISKGARNITEAGLNSSSAKLMPAGTVLFTSRAPIGYVAIATNEISTNQGFKSFILKSEDILPDYVYWWLKGNKQLAESMASGTTFLELSGSKAKQLPIPIAPPEQQKRIVAKIEELLSHIDAGIGALKKAKQLLKQYRQSVLKAAVTGELTKEWRKARIKDDAQGSANVAGGRTRGATKLEPASQLLERILKERRKKWEEQQLEQFKAKGKMPKDDKWKEKYKEPLMPEFEHVNVVPDIPSTWEWVTVSQLTSEVKDGPHYSPKYADKGIPFITGGNVRPQGVDFENTKYITKELHEELSKRCKPELNDILYTKGGTTGIARVNTYDFEFNVWVHVAVLRLVNTNLIVPFYMQHSLNSQLCYTQSQKYTHGVGNQDLGLTRMIKICLALPPVDEQREIIEIIDEKMSSITRVEEQIENLLVIGEKNKQSVLVAAFSGDLVDNNYAGESASELLKRIAKDRALAASKSKIEKKIVSKKKVSKMSKRPIIDVLSEAGGPIGVDEIFEKAGYASNLTAENVEKFYSELKKVTEMKEVEVSEETKSGMKQADVFLYKA